jgi:hypothetical protein
MMEDSIHMQHGVTLHVTIVHRTGAESQPEEEEENIVSKDDENIMKKPSLVSE